MANKFNDALNYAYNESQYFHVEPRSLVSTKNCGCNVGGNVTKDVIKVIKTQVVKEVKSSITPGKGVNVKEDGDKVVISTNIKGGNGVTVTTNNDSTIIESTLKKNYNEKQHIEEVDIEKGSNLDDVVDKLLKAIDENGNTLDGEEVKF